MENALRGRRGGRRGKRGATGPAAAFTLIELLVVIAIIGILAAMLFPVFARARESARKTQCLANVKNIAMAVQMYLNDYDQTPPWEHRPEVIDWFASSVCDDPVEVQHALARLNPYLGWSVVLDDYVKNRDVWRCPSAALEAGATGVNGYPDWFSHVAASPDWCTWVSPKVSQSFPSGWGGEVTDSIDQQAYGVRRQGITSSGPGGAFVESVGVLHTNRELGLSRVRDSATFVIVSDMGFANDANTFASAIAYPDLCGLGTCPWGEGEYCEGTEMCRVIEPGPRRDHTRLKHGTRHLGGSNLGFLDGHAKWWTAEAILAQSPRWSQGCGGYVVRRGLDGFDPVWPTTAAGDAAAGVPEGWVNPSPSTPGCAPLY